MWATPAKVAELALLGAWMRLDIGLRCECLRHYEACRRVVVTMDAWIRPYLGRKCECL